MRTVLAHTSRLARGGLRRFGGSALLVALGRVAFLAFFAVAARFSSVAQFGEFATSLALAQILAVPATLGTGPAAQAILPGALHGSSTRVSDLFIRFSATATLLATLAIGVALLLVTAVSNLLAVPGNLSTMTVGALWLLPGVSLGTLREFIARSTGHIRLALLPRDVVWTLACMAAIVAVPAFNLQLVIGCAILLVAIECIATILLVRRLNCWPMRRVPFRPFRRWRDRSIALMANNTGGQLLDRFDIFVVGTLFSLESAALYSVASRLAPLASLSQRFIVPIQAAKISLAMFNKDWPRARAELWTGVATGAAFAAVVLLIFLVANQLVLGLYGPAYLAATPLLLILTVGQASTAIGSNFGLVVSMGPRSWVLAKLIWLTVIPASILAYLIAPLFGLLGVAITAAGAVTLYNTLIARAAIHTLSGE